MPVSYTHLSHSFANIISMKISNILRTDKTLDFSFYIIGWVCLILALVLGLAWRSGYFLWIFPPDGCVLHNLTGYYCPGCGGTRAIHALLHGHIVRSFFYHPIVVYTAVFFGWFMLSQTIEKASRGRFAIGMHYRDIYLWIALAIVLLNWLVKNPVSYTHLDVYKRQPVNRSTIIASSVILSPDSAACHIFPYASIKSS